MHVQHRHMHPHMPPRLEPGEPDLIQMIGAGLLIAGVIAYILWDAARLRRTDPPAPPMYIPPPLTRDRQADEWAKIVDGLTRHNG